MASIDELMKQRAAIDQQLQSKRREAIESIRAQMTVMGITVADLQVLRTATKREAKYSDGKNSWSGVGARPRWLQKAIASGVTLESLLVKAK